MEMNTRLQVEHPVTEAITGLDLVEWQLRVASGEPLPLAQDDLAIAGHAVEARVYAEDPARGFLPQTGRLARLSFPEGVRVDAGVRAGDAVTPFYDPMIAKVIAHGPTRAVAVERLRAALSATQAVGCTTNVAFLARLLADPDFMAGDVDTGLIDRRLAALVAEPPPPAEVIAAAAIAAVGLDEPAAGDDPYQALRGFRLWGPAADHVRLHHGDVALDLAVEGEAGRRYAVVTPAGAVRLALLPAPAGLLRADLGDRVAAFRLMRDGARLTVSTGAAAWTFTLDDVLAAAADEEAGADSVRAPMPGLVTAVLVAEGQSVRRGDPLVVTEAMKMEHTLTAGRDGRVAAVRAAVGERVAEGTVLVTLEPADG
jgi:3-methylcrotonyl-CoA carboxylase alpha subunit